MSRVSALQRTALAERSKRLAAHTLDASLDCVRSVLTSLCAGRVISFAEAAEIDTRRDMDGFRSHRRASDRGSRDGVCKLAAGVAIASCDNRNWRVGLGRIFGMVGDEATGGGRWATGLGGHGTPDRDSGDVARCDSRSWQPEAARMLTSALRFTNQIHLRSFRRNDRSRLRQHDINLTSHAKAVR